MHDPESGIFSRIWVMRARMTNEKAAVFGNRRYWESYITYKTFIWDLEMGGGIGRGGIGETTVALGLERDTDSI